MTSAVGKNTVSGEQLRGFVERVERIREEKKGLSQDESAIFAEAKAAGFVPGTIRTVLKVRAQKPHDRQEAEALLDMYLHALGMAEEPPLFRAMNAIQADPSSEESLMEAFKRFAPQEGDIILRMGKTHKRVWRDEDGAAHVDDYIAPQPSSAKAAGRPAGSAGKPNKPEPPAVDEAGAVGLGRQYARENRAVIDNPFPFGDPRRARFDEGWRAEMGSDGMGPEE